MVVVGMHEAKTHFSKLVKRAAAGEEVVVTRSGEPVAKIVAYERSTNGRPIGLLKGKIKIHPGFDEIPPGWEEYIGD
jgi:prevent-host-death family protein